jgi:hypothetical protein
MATRVLAMSDWRLFMMPKAPMRRFHGWQKFIKASNDNAFDQK